MSRIHRRNPRHGRRRAERTVPGMVRAGQRAWHVDVARQVFWHVNHIDTWYRGELRSVRKQMAKSMGGGVQFSDSDPVECPACKRTWCPKKVTFALCHRCRGTQTGKSKFSWVSRGRFCDFCKCESCKKGWDDYPVSRLPVEGGRHICETCYFHEAWRGCRDSKGEFECEDHARDGFCRHRPRLKNPRAS